MNYKMMGKFLSQILFLEAVLMLPALFICIAGQTMRALAAFAASIGITVAVALLLYIICRKAEKRFYAREGMVCVGICWMAMSILGCLPFFLSGEIPNYLDALFEIVSGFTTTGATILGDVEAMSDGMLYWRSFSHWLGGMGVLVFVLALTSSKEQGGGFTMHLLRAESPGPDVGKLVPKMRTTARILYMIYILLTVLNFMFLMLGDMPFFESVCTALGTAGTGGFGVKNDSIAGYSPYLQNVCTVFMLLFGINFSCYYMLLIKQVRAVLKDEEIRLYLGTVAAAVALIAWNIRGCYDTVAEAVRHSAFQVASIITTTGFATTDFDLWPSFSKGILFVLMILGACAGSTGGGLKCGRALLLFKSMKRNTRRILNPKRVEVVRLNGRMISEKVLETTNTYLVAYGVIVILSFLLISIDGFSLTTNLSAVLACFNNIGPGFESVGPTCNFSIFSGFSKVVLIIDMLAGRLEIFPMLLLVSRSTWRHR